MKLAEVYDLVKVEVEEIISIGRTDNLALEKKAKELSKIIDDKLEEIYMEDKVDRDKEGHKLLRYIEEAQDVAYGRAFKVRAKLEDIDLNHEI